MHLNKRQELILEKLRSRGVVDVKVLADMFNITSQTLRRDLTELCEMGLATRTHGGAKRLISTLSRGYEERRLSYSQEKKIIGELAAACIPNNCSIILNIGTTVEQVARALTAHRDLLVISNNINVIEILTGTLTKNLIIVGGAVRPSDGAIVGDDAVNFISQYKVDFAVIGASSIDTDGSILDYDSREVAVSRTILKNARSKILVADISKFEHNAPVRIYNIAEIDFMICNTRPPEKFLDATKKGSTKVLTPE